MSHLSTRKVSLKDTNILRQTCAKLGYTYTGMESVKFFDGTVVDGTSIQIPGWKFPVVVKADGTAAYDNYNNRWGNIADLNKLEQHYAIELTKNQWALEGLSWTERQYDNGNIELLATVPDGGAM